MRYKCILQDNDIIIKDTIDNEEYNTKDLDINELGYLNVFASDFFMNELHLVKGIIEGYKKLGEQYGNKRIRREEERYIEVINSVDADGVISTSPILEETVIDKTLVGSLKEIVVNSDTKCTILFQEAFNDVRIKVKNPISELRVLNATSDETVISVSEKDLLNVGNFITSRIVVKVRILELDNNKLTKEIKSELPCIWVTCDKFDMLNLLNIPNSFSYVIEADIYNIGTWLRRVKKKYTLTLHGNIQILEWLSTLKDCDFDPAGLKRSLGMRLYYDEGTIDRILPKEIKSVKKEYKGMFIKITRATIPIKVNIEVYREKV